jgi:DNA-binding NarL/FixJ family response regulator
MKRTKIVIVEDSVALRTSIARMLAGQPDMRVVATLGSGDDLLLKMAATNPQVIIVGVGLIHVNEALVTISAREIMPGVNVIGMGLDPSRSDVLALVEAGAAGFILKEATEKKCLSTIRSVAEGIRVLPSVLTGPLFSHIVRGALKNRKETVINGVRMTKRERDIGLLVADGMSNKEIGLRLNISTYTVKSHMHNILTKCSIHTRAQIAQAIGKERP